MVLILPVARDSAIQEGNPSLILFEDSQKAPQTKRVDLIKIITRRLHGAPVDSHVDDPRSPRGNIDYPNPRERDDGLLDNATAQS